jgi:hypothetical protein
VNINIGGQVTAYASGYNNTGSTYVGLVEVDWTDIPDLGMFDNETGTNTIFTAGFIGGPTNITGQNASQGLSDNFTVVIADPTIDYIIITDGPDGNELGIENIDIGGQVTAYASGYNNTGPIYIGLVEVDWTDIPDLGTFDNDTGTNTVFTAGLVGGSTTITGQNVTLAVSDTFYVDITNATVDYIQIRDAAGGGGSIVTSLTLDVGQSTTLWAAAYNYTSSYLGDYASTNWSESSGGSVINVTTPGGSTTVQAQLIGGNSTITAEYNGIQNTTNVTVNPPTIDFITITNTPGGTAFDTVVLDIGGNVTTYASGYNATSGYVDLVEVAWTDIPDLGTFDNDTGTDTIFTAGLTGGSTNINGQNVTQDLSDNFTVVITTPTVDYIIITD